MSLFKRVAAAWDRVVSGPQFGRSDDDFVQLDLELLEDRRLLSAGLAAAFTGGVLTITDSTADGEDVEVRVSGDILSIFDMSPGGGGSPVPLQIDINGNGLDAGDPTFLDLSAGPALTQINVNFNVGSDRLSVPLLDGVGLNVQGGLGTDFVRIFDVGGVHDAGISGHVEIHAETIEINSGHYDSLSVWLDGNVESHDGVNWHASSFDIDGNLELDGHAEFLAGTNGSGTFDVSGSVIEHAGGVAGPSSLTATGWNSLDLHGPVTLDGDLTISATSAHLHSATTLGGDLSLTTADLDIDVAVSADEVTLIGNDIDIGATGSIHSARTTLAPLDTSYGLHIGVADGVNFVGIDFTELGKIDSPTIHFGGLSTPVSLDASATLATGREWELASLSLAAGINLTVDGLLDGNLALLTGAVLSGRGTISGNVTGTGNVAPGGANGAGFGVLSVGGDFNINGQLRLDVNSPWNVPGTNHDQLVVGGALNLATTSLVFSNTASVAPTAQQVVTLIRHDGAATTTAAATHPQGTSFLIGGRAFRPYYNGGDGNDVVLVEASTPTIAYAEDTAWSAMTPGTVIADADLGAAGNQPAVYGVNAFSTVTAALAAVTTTGRVIVNDGTYAEAVTIQNSRILATSTNSNVTISSLATAATTGQIEINGQLLTIGDGTSTLISGIISGPGAFTKSGSGTVTISGANTYSGTTTIDNGTLQLGAANVIPDGVGKGNVVINSGGTLALGATTSETINGLSGSGKVDHLAAGTATLTIGGGDQSSTFSGQIVNSVGTVNLAKTGTGTIVLSGSNSFAGTTTVGTGTLEVSGSLSGAGAKSVSAGATLTVTSPGIVQGAVTIAGLLNGSGTLGGNLTINNLGLREGAGTVNGTVTVNSGGTLGGTGSIVGAITVNSGGKLAPGSGGTGTLNVGNVTFANGSQFVVEIESTGQFNDRLNASGTVTIGSTASLVLVDAGTGTIAPRQSVEILSKSTGTVSGTFSGGSDGQLLTVSGTQYRVYYNGGDGNDVVLIRNVTPLPVVYVSTAFTGPAGTTVDSDPNTAGIQEATIGIDAFSTMVPALAAVDPLGTVRVFAGTYYHTGTLVISKSVTIEGAGMDSTQIRRAGAPVGNFDVAIQITANDVTIKNVQLGWETHSQVAFNAAVDYKGYVVVTNADRTTISSVRFGDNTTREGYRSAVVFEGSGANGADYLTVKDSIFEGRWGRALIRDGNNGSGEHFLITHNEFREYHYRWGPIGIGPQDDGGTANNFAYSGEISFNYFGNRVEAGAFQEAGDQNFTVTITNKGITADGVQIVHNTFDWQDADTLNQSGKNVQAVGVYFEPSLTVTSTTVIRDNIFNGFQYNGPQPTAEQPLWHQNGGVSFDGGSTYTGSIEFDGVNDFGMFVMPDDVGDKGTLSFWVQIDDAGMNRRNEFFEGPGNAGLEMQYNGGSGTGVVYGRTTTVGGDFVIRSGGDKALLDSNLSGQSTNWHNIQYTWNKATGEMRIYIDGAETSYASGSTPTDLVWATAVNTINQLMNVGRDGSGDTTRFLDGQMDDIAWFNDVLTTTERNEIRTDGVNAHASALAGKLVVHWDFDAAPTGKVFYDTVNNTQLVMSTDGIVPFGPTYHATGGPIGNSGTLEFDGTDDFATFRSANFDVGESGTLSFWVQMDDTSRRNQFFEGPGNTGMEFQYRNNSGGQVYGRTSDNGDFVIRAGTTQGGNPGDASLMNSVLPGQTTNWHNVQYTWDYNASNGTGKMHIYIDGVETGYASTFTPADLNWTTIVNTVNGMMNVGRDPGDATRYFNGQMDDVAFYKGVLDTNELNGIRTQGVGNYAVDNTLVASWNFDSAPNSDGTFNGSNGTSIKLYVQQLVPDPPIYGYGLIGPAGANVNHNLFYNNDQASNLTLNPANGNRVSNEVGLNPLLDPLFQRTGATLEQQYTLRFGSGAAYFSSEFLGGNVATATPHIGAYQDDPVSVASNNVLVAGTDDDDLLVVTFTGVDSGSFVLTRHVGTVNQDVLGPIDFVGLNKLTFQGFGGDDVLIIQQPTGTLYSIKDGILFEGGGEDNTGNALASDGINGGDTLVLLAQDGTVIDSSAYVFLDASSAGNHNGSIKVVDGALSTIITFHDSDAIRDNLAVDARSFKYSSNAATETITLLAPGDILTLTGFPPTANIGPVTLANKITSNRGPAVSFANPNASLAIDADLGNDTVNVTSVDGAFAASLSIDGGAGNDVIVVTTDLNLGSTTSAGQLILTAERIDLGADITTTGQQTYNGPVVLTKSVTLTLAGSDTASIDLDSVDGNGFHLTISSTGSVVASGMIDLTNGGNPSGNLSVTFDADGDSVNTASLVDVAAGKVTVTTGGGCDDTLTLNGAVTATADVKMTSIGVINVNGPIATTTGSITLDACIDIALAAAADLTTGGGLISLTAGQDITGAAGADISTAADAAGNVTVTAGRNISLAGAIKAAGAGLLVGNGGNVQIQTLNGTIALADVIATATAPGTAGNVTIQSRGAGAGTGNNVVLNGQVSTSSGGTVRIESSGAIVDGSLVEGTDITATNVLLRASTGIGSGTAGNAGDLDLVMAAGSTTLSLAAVTNGGDINLQVTGPVTITNVTGTTIGADSIAAFAGVAIVDSGAANAGGRLTVTSTSSLTVAVAAPVANADGGSITLASQGSAGDLSINSDVTATGGSGAVTLLAGHDVLLNGTSVVSATGAASVLIAAGEDLANGTPQAGSADGDVTMADGTRVSATSGAVTVRATTDVTLSEVSATSVTVTADSNQFGLANGTGEIIDADAGTGTDITAATIDLNAGSGIGAANGLELAGGTSISADTTSGAIDLDHVAGAAVTVTSLTSGTTGGTINFDQTGDKSLDLRLVSTTNGNVTITNTGGAGANITVGVIAADTTNDLVSLTSTGAINDDVGDLDVVADITAFQIDLNAASGIGNTAALELAAQSISADTTAGAIDLDNAATTAVTVTSLTTGGTGGSIDFDQTGNQSLQLQSVRTTNGNVTITNTGGTGADITIGFMTADKADDVVTITSSGAIDDDIANPEVVTDIDAYRVDLNAVEGIGATAHVDLSALVIAADTTDGDIRLNNNLAGPATVTVTSLTTGNTVAGEEITFIQTGGAAVKVTGDVSTGANGGKILLVNEDHRLTIDGNVTSDDDIDITAAEDIIIRATVRSTGGNISVQADTGAGPLANNGLGGVHIDEVGSLKDAKVDAFGSVTITGANLVEDGNVEDPAPDTTIEAVVIDFDGVNVQVQAGTSITIASQSGVSKPTDSDLIINGRVTTNGTLATDTITITANHDVFFGINGDVTGHVGDITVTADAAAGSTGGAITMADGGADWAIINGGAAYVLLRADGDVRLGQVNTTGDVTVTSSNAAIIDNIAAEATAANAASANIIGNVVTLSAVTGIGSSAAPALGDAEDIDINAVSLAAVNTGSGAIQIFETDNVALRDVSATDAISNAGRAVVIDAGGSITDFNTASDAFANITAGTAVLRAGTGIGSDAVALGDIDTTTPGSGTLVLNARTTSGDIAISQVGSLQVDTAGGQSGVTIGAAAVNAADDITLFATNAVTINQAIANRNGGDIAITAGTAAVSSDPADVLTVSANIAATAADGTVSLSGFRIVQNAAAATTTEGTGAVSYTAYRDISFATATSITTQDGSITLQANTAAAATGTFAGIVVNGATITTGDATHRGGDILLEGHGGTAGIQNVGVAIANGAIVRSQGQDTLLGAAGSITIRGTGGVTGTDENHGVFIGTTTAGLSAVMSVDGDISIVGTAGGTGSNNDGVRMIAGATVTSTGTTGGVRTAATITMNGTGGNGTDGNRGVIITDAGTAVASVDGDISVTGQGGGTGVNGHGLVVGAGADIRSSGAASIGIIGTSSTASTGGGGGNGVRIAGNSTVQVTTGGTGTITITGRDGTGANDAAVLIDASTVRTDTTLITVTGVNQDVTMANAGAIRSNLGDARIRSSRNVLLGIVNLDDDGATTGGAGTAYITADADTSLLAGGLVSNGAGEIVDNLTGESANVTALAAVFRAGSGIGNFSYVFPGDDTKDINVEVETLAALTGTGDLFISDVSNVTVAALDGLTNGLQIAGGLDDLLVRAAGNMTIDSAVVVQSPFGSLTLAAGVNGPSGTLDVNANVAATGGDTRLVARDGVDLNGAVQVGLTSQNVEIHAGRVFQYSQTLAAGNANANVAMATDAQVVSRYAFLNATGDVSISRVTSTFTTYVIADSDQSRLGAIIDSRTLDGAGNVNITATNASLRAGSGIGTTDALDLTVSTVAAETDSGSIRLDNTTSLSSGIVLKGFLSLSLTPGTYGRDAAGDVAALSGITIRDAIGTGADPQDAAMGAIVVQATGSITVSSAILNGDAGEIALDANGAGVTLNAAVTSQNDAGTLTGTVRISADGSVTQSTAGIIRAANLGVRTTAGEIDLLVAQNDVDILSAATAGADIGFRDADGFQLSLVIALNDAAFDTPAIYAATSGLTAAGATIRLVGDGTAGTAAANSITQDGVNGPITAAALGIRLTGGDVLLDPNPASSINDVDTLAIRVTPSAGLGGNVDFSDADDLTIGTVLSGGHANFADTSGIATQTGNIDVRTINGTMTVAQAVSTTGLGTVRLDANGANSDLVVQATITSGSGSITLEADDSVTFTSAGDVTSTSGNVTVTANADAAAGDGAGLSGSGLPGDEIFMADGAVIDAGSGRIILSTAGTGGGHVTIGQLITTNSGTVTPAVQITSQQQVRDGGDTGGEDIIAATGRLVIDAQSGVGNSTVAGATAAIETRVASLDLQNHVSGNVDLLETNNIDVIRIAQQLAAGSEDGTAFVTLATTAGSILLVDSTSGGSGVAARRGQVTLQAGGTAGDITLNSGITTKGGDVRLEAGDDIRSTVGDNITTTDDAGAAGASGAVVLLAHAGTADGGAAGVIDLAGDVITSGSADQNAGDITITNDDGTIAVTSLLARGGSAGAGGAAGSVSLFANDLGGNDSHNITLNRQIVARAGGASVLHGQVQVVADGAIVDSDETALDIDAGSVRLVATTGIAGNTGLDGDNRALEINADTLAATTVTGSIVLCDEAGGLTIGTVAGTSGVTVTGVGGGQIVIEVEGAGSALVVNSQISTAGTTASAATIDLSATGITLATAAADVIAAAGEITLDANSGAFASVAGAVVTSPAIVRISADTIDLQGTVHSAAQVRLAADTASTAISLGTGANGAGGFALDEVELNNIEAPIVRIGTAGADTVELCDGSSVALWAGPTTGAITFTGAFTSDSLFGTNFLELFTRSSVTATAGGVDLSAATTDLVIRAGAAVNFANDAHDLQTVAVVTNNNAGSTLTNSAITLRDTAGMTIGTVDGLSGLTTAGGAISVTTLGSAADLQVEQAVTNTGANAISLVAGLHINFTASGDVTTQGGPVTVTADAFSVANTGGAITMADGTVIRGTTANITLTADGDIRLGQVLTGGTTGNVTVTTTSGAIRDNTAAEASANNATNANIVGNIVSLSAATGIGSGSASLGDTADIDINAQSLSAVNTLSGAIQIFETDSVALRDLSATDTISNVGRTIVIDAAGAITDFTPGADAQANITGGAVTLRATTGIGSDDDLDTDISQLTATNTVSGNIQVSEINLPGSNGLELLAVSNQSGNVVIQTLDGPLTVSGPVSTTGAGVIDLRAGNADAPAGETLLVNGSLVTQSGRITLAAEGGDIRFTANGDVTTTSGDVVVVASAAVDQQNGSIINAGTGSITIIGGADVTLARLGTTNATDAAVTVVSTAGRIVKAAGSGENIGAGAGLVNLSATSGVGSAAAIGTDAGRLRITNSAAGDVRIAETNGVDLRGISQFGPGLIDLTAGGTVVIAAGTAVQSANGSITMQANGAIDMQDFSLVDAGTGRITVVAAGDVGLSLVRTTGDGATTGVVSITSTFGQIRDNDLTGALDVQAASLAMTAAAGIGNGNPIETSVANLAALAQSGSILVTNSAGGAALNITSVAGVTGLTNNDTSGGSIIITHDGPMNINAPVQSSALFGTSPEQGVVRFSTATASAVDGDITVNSWINAPRARLDIAASGDVAINDAFVAVDVLAASVQAAAGTNDPTGSTTHGITVAPGTVISSSTGAVNDVIPRLENFVASQITALGVARIDFDYGRAPDEVSFTLIIDWGDGTRDVVTLPGGTPGHATFEHTYAGNPNAGNPAAPIPVTVTVLNDDNITFLVAGKEVDFNTQTEENAVPGDGLQTAIVYDLAIVVPDLETPRTIVTDSQHASVQAITQLTTTVDLATAIDAKATVEGRIVIAHRLGLDGKPLTDADGNPIQVVFTEEQTALFLADLGKLYQSLDSGKFRIYVQEGDGRPLLVSVVTLRSGVPVTGNEATLDRPPTSDSDMGEQEGDDADLNMVVPPPPPLPSLVQGESDREPVARAGSPTRGFLAMVGHYLKNLGLM